MCLSNDFTRRETDEPSGPLVLHVDLNGTILANDSARGEDVLAYLHRELRRRAAAAEGPLLGRERLQLGLEPIVDRYAPTPDSTPTNANPDPRGLLTLRDQLVDRLRAGQDVPEAAVQWSGGLRVRRIVPSFLRLLRELDRQKRQWRVVLRTFGHELAETVAALQESGLFSEAEFVVVGRDQDGCPAVLDPRPCIEGDANRTGSRRVLSSDVAGALDRPEVRLLCVQDDFFHWNEHDRTPEAGKPMFLDLHSKETHLFLDDNIERNAENSIVGVFARRGELRSYRMLSGEECAQYYGSVLLRPNILDAIDDDDYYVKMVRTAEKRYQRVRATLPA